MPVFQANANLFRNQMGTRTDAIEIREANAGDVEGVLACLRAAFAIYKDLYTPSAFADTVLDHDLLEVRMRRMHVLVAKSEAQVIGTISGMLGEDGEGHLRGMAVLPSYHRSGVATQLLSAIERWLKTNGCEQVTLDTTLPLQPAMKFYEKAGYRRSGRTKDFFGMQLIEYAKNL